MQSSTERCPIINNDSKDIRSCQLGEKRLMPAPAVDSLASSTLTATTASAESITTSWKAGQPVSHQQGPPVQAAAGKLTQVKLKFNNFDLNNSSLA